MALTKLNNNSSADGILTDVEINTGTLSGTHILGYSSLTGAWINADPSVWFISKQAETISNITWSSASKALNITRANATFGPLTLTDVAIENSNATFADLTVDDISVDNGTNSIMRADASLNKVQILTDLFVTGSVYAQDFVRGEGNTTAFSLAANGRITTGENLVVTGDLTTTGFTSTGIDDNATSTALTIDSDERVGINITPTNRTFEVKSIADAQIIASFETGSSITGRIAIADANTTADNSVGIGSTGNNLDFYAGAAAKATLSSAGNLSVTGNLTSLGIDDNATSTQIEIDSNNNIKFGYGSEAIGAGKAIWSLKDANGGNTHVGWVTSGNSDDTASAYYTYGSAGSANWRTYDASASLYTTNMTITSAGNLGIGDTSPDAGLTVHNNAGAVIATSNIARQTYTSVGNFQVSTAGAGGILIHSGASSAGYLTFGDGGIGGRILYDHASNFMSFTTNGITERMRINAGGNVEVTSGQLNVSTDIYAVNNVVSGNGSGSTALTTNDGGGNANVTFNHIGTSPDQNGNAGRLAVNVDSTSNCYMAFQGKSNVTSGVNVTLDDMVRMYADSGDFHANGNVVAYSTTISDERLKENVEQVTGALDMLDQIRGVTFDRKDTGKKSAGVIAQELEKVMPYAIYETALPLKTGSEDDVYKLVEYDALHAVLIEAIKELRAEVEALRAATN